MRNIWRKTALLVLAALLVVLVPGVLLYRAWWVPNRRFADEQWLAKASGQELLANAHQVLSFPVGSHHDAFVIVLRQGGPESVPYLLAALRWQPNTGPGECMARTKSHCLEALRRITGCDAGLNYADWANWWESVGRQCPPATMPAAMPARDAAHSPPADVPGHVE